MTKAMVRALVCCALASTAACAGKPTTGTTYPATRETPGFTVLYLSRLARPADVSNPGNTLVDLAHPANSVRIPTRGPRPEEIDSRLGRADQAFSAELRDLLAGPAHGPARGFAIRRIDGVDAKDIPAELEADRFTSDDLLAIWPARSDLACRGSLSGAPACDVRLSFTAILYDGETMERLWSDHFAALLQRDSALGSRDDPGRAREAAKSVWSDVLARMRAAGVIDRPVTPPAPPDRNPPTSSPRAP